MKRVGVFVDVQNIYYTTRDEFGRQFNYRRFWQFLAKQGDIQVAKAYATDRGDEGQRKFQSALRHIGFDVQLKPYIQRADGSAKGDWDVGLTIDVLDAAPQLDILFLLSGDGDFDLLVTKVQRDFNLQVEVVGVPKLTADALIRCADRFHAIDGSMLL
jgi:uncharacterized LabA/DUF88 family protein